MQKYFHYRGLDGEQTKQLSSVLATSMKSRILSGKTVDDTQAKPLSARGPRGGYAGAKARRGLQPIRDLRFSGNTLAALVPLSTEPGQVRVGFSNPVAQRIAAINNARSEQYGVSGRDRAAVVEAVNPMVKTLVVTK